MLDISLICVGRLKELYYTEAADEYRKRLSGCCRLNVVEIPEQRLPDNPSGPQIDAALRKEREAINKRCPERAFTAAMCVEGLEISSTELSEFLMKCAGSGVSKICFITGGSYGLHPDLKAAADARFSLSRMTFPHHLARIIILEQLYRAFSIAEGGKYHK